MLVVIVVNLKVGFKFNLFTLALRTVPGAEE